MFWFGAEGRPNPEFQLASYAIGPAFYVYCGTKMAPNHRFGTAIALTILWTITAAAILAWNAAIRGYDQWSQTGKPLVWGILGIVSMLGTCFLVYKTEQHDRLIDSFSSKRKAPVTASSTRGDAQNAVDVTPQVVDPYATLGVDRTASFEAIRQAYRERMKEYHPDKVAGLGHELRTLAELKTKAINIAFDELKRLHGPV
jgi:DnaJ like chaperone protein